MFNDLRTVSKYCLFHHPFSCFFINAFYYLTEASFLNSQVHGIDHLVIPTTDYLFAPSPMDISRAVDFIHGKDQNTILKIIFEADLICKIRILF